MSLQRIVQLTPIKAENLQQKGVDVLSCQVWEKGRASYLISLQHLSGQSVTTVCLEKIKWKRKHQFAEAISSLTPLNEFLAAVLWTDALSGRN